MRRSRALGVIASGVALGVGLSACGSDSSGDGTARVVVTTPVLGAIVTDVVGDDAGVTVVIPDGADPHDFQPSARDVAALNDATLIVANGEDFEEGLERPLEAARQDGVSLFTATEHVELLSADEDEKPEDEEEGHSEGEEEEHDHGDADPHIFNDPDRMATVALALGEALAAEGLDVRGGAADTAERYRALDRELSSVVATVPEDRRSLVTGHESLGYWADRYGFDVVATVVPNLSTTASVSAADVAGVTDIIERQGVPAIFAEPDTAPEVAEAIAQETGARVVTVHTESFGPDAETYEDYLRQLTEAIAGGLGGGGSPSTG